VLGYRIRLEAKLSCYCHVSFLQNPGARHKNANLPQIICPLYQESRVFSGFAKKISARVSVTQQKGSARAAPKRRPTGCNGDGGRET
jgi:hypothetical protein